MTHPISSERNDEIVFTAELLLAIEEMHKKNIIHRYVCQVGKWGSD